MRSTAVLLTTALVCAVAACAGGGNGEDGGTTTAPPTSTPPETTASTVPEHATEQGLRDLEVGDCFQPIDDPLANDKAVWSLPCEDPHTHEVYDVLDYQGEGAEGGSAFPGVAIVQDWSEQACHDRFEAFMGVRWTLSELDIQVWWPSEESWGRGDRTVVCTVFSPSGELLRGSQRGSAR